MDSIHCLPDEIIDLCAKQLRGDQKSLYSLIRSSCRLHAIGATHLWHTIRFTTPTWADRLIRALNARPNLVERVRDFSAVWGTPPRSASNCYERIDQIAGRLTKLKKLELCARSKCVMPFKFKAWNPLLDLNTVVLKGELHPVDIAVSVAKNTVRDLDLIDLKYDSAALQALIPKVPARSLSMNELTLQLTLDNQTSAKALRTWVQMRPNLRSLTCRFYMPAEGSNQAIPQVGAQPSVPATQPMFLPHYLTTLARPALANLRVLVLRSNGQRPPSESHLAIDFRKFPHLQILQAPAIYFFKTDDPSPSRTGAWRKLPSSLIDLVMLFDPLQGLLIEDGETTALSVRGFPKQTSYKWVFDLLHNKAQHLPQFKRLLVVQAERVGRWAFTAWPTPSRLQLLAAEVGVNFEVGCFTAMDGRTS